MQRALGPFVSEHLEANLRALAARDPERAAAVAAAPALAAALETAASGAPTLFSDGVLLHNRQDPAREAGRWAAGARERLAGDEDATAVVVGFGLGYHVEALAAAWPGRVVVVEPDASLLRTALAARDLSALLARVTLAPEPLPESAIDAFGRMVVLPYGPAVLRGGPALRAAKERLTGRAAVRDLRLRILVVSPLMGGSYPMTGWCARALAELGHEVTVLDLAPFASGLQALAAFTSQKGARRAVEEAWGRFLGTGVLAAVDAAKPDLLLGMAQAPLDATVLAEVKKRGVVRAFWFVEDHRLFAYWRHVVPEYDYFFAIQQGEFLDEAARLCPGRVAYLPCAADPAVHRPLALSAAERAELGAPVGFVGAGYRNRRIVFRSLLDQGLRIWGTEWAGAGQVEAAVERGGARIAPEDAVRIFNATDVNLNLHSSTYVDGVEPRGDFVNPRTFELAAAGAFQLVDERALLPSLLAPGREVATFADARELPALVAHWLARPEERRAIAEAGRARVLAEHTYRHRMATLLETVLARDYEGLRARPREETVRDAARAEGETPLGDLLRKLPAVTPYTLEGVAQALLHRRGPLSDPEAILLFLHQFDELYVREARAA
jgi:spore maturation protein CgeB